MLAIKATNIDAFIKAFPEDVQLLLEQLRTTIRKAAPAAGEKIGYGIPTFTWHGNLVHFSAYKHHIGFYPGSSGIKAFQKELSEYYCSKGTVQFPLDKPLPLALVTKIVKFRMKENEEKAKAKQKKTGTARK